MRRKDVVAVGAVLLIVISVACIVYAVVELRKANQSLQPIQPAPASPQGHQDEGAGAARGIASEGSGGETETIPLRQWARHWLLLVLLLVLLMVVALIMLRRFRPARLQRRAPPSDTTDLWREAGKRLK